MHSDTAARFRTNFHRGLPQDDRSWRLEPADQSRAMAGPAAWGIATTRRLESPIAPDAKYGRNHGQRRGDQHGIELVRERQARFCRTMRNVGRAQVEQARN